MERTRTFGWHLMVGYSGLDTGTKWLMRLRMGGYWGAHRASKAGFAPSEWEGKCPLCMLTVRDDAYHALWGCPKHAETRRHCLVGLRGAVRSQALWAGWSCEQRVRYLLGGRVTGCGLGHSWCRAGPDEQAPYSAELARYCARVLGRRLAAVKALQAVTPPRADGTSSHGRSWLSGRRTPADNTGVFFSGLKSRTTLEGRVLRPTMVPKLLDSGDSWRRGSGIAENRVQRAGVLPKLGTKGFPDL